MVSRLSDLIDDGSVGKLLVRRHPRSSTLIYVVENFFASCYISQPETSRRHD